MWALERKWACYRVLIVPRTAGIGIRSNFTRKRILCKGSSDRTNAYKAGYRLIDSRFVHHERTEKTPLEEWEGEYVGGGNRRYNLTNPNYNLPN